MNMNNTQETEFDYQTHMKESARGPSEINRGTKAREERREAAKARISQNGQLRRVLEKIQEIAEKSADSDYIYRGEPEHYKKVSSSLYREHSDIDAEHFDIEVVQNEILEEARKFTRETNDFAILTELQHYGYNTNLIDFTTDCHIALFFACYRDFDKDGRILLLQKTNPHIIEPRSPFNRVIAQKSIFVRPPKGFIKPDHVINIPEDLKQFMLDHLWKSHGISMETIYNDLHGFIRYQNVHQSAYAEFYAGLTCQNERDYSKAIGHYSRAIELNPRSVEAYNNCGIAYRSIGDVDRDIEDYDKAIELNPEYADVYNNRGVAYKRKGDVDRDIEDYDKAIELNPEYADVYNNRGVAYIEKGDVDRAIEDYDKAIELNPGYAEAYNNHGVAYKRKGDVDRAIEDYNKAIESDLEHTKAHCNRGISWLSLQNWKEAKSDLTFAKSKGLDIIATFRNDYENVEQFEQKNSVKLPEDIAAMLTP